MGNQTSTQASKSVSDIVNKSMNKTSSSSTVQSDSQNFQDATVNVINKSSGTCKPTIQVDLSQQATLASINSNQSQVSQDVTTQILNKAEQLAKQGSVQTQSGLLKMSNQNSKQTIEQIQKQKNNIQNIVQNAMKSVINQNSSQKGVINFTDESHYQCYKNQNPNNVPPIKLGIKQLATLVAKNSSSSITEALAKTNLKNVSTQSSEQKSSQKSTGLLAAFGQTFIIIAAVIGGVCLIGCLAMMFMGKGLPDTSQINTA